ncbi:MAG: MarR family transcriptional regulator [Armatimonas sp.]
MAEISELEAHLGYWMRRVSNHVSEAFAQKLQERQTSVTEWVALRLIHGHAAQQNSITAGELAQQLDMTKGAISKVLDKLEAKAWIARTTNPNDNRVQWLALTAQGQQILPELATIADANDAAFFGCLDAQEQATLRALLEKLTRTHGWDTPPTE